MCSARLLEGIATVLDDHDLCPCLSSELVQIVVKKDWKQ